MGFYLLSLKKWVIYVESMATPSTQYYINQKSGASPQTTLHHLFASSLTYLIYTYNQLHTQVLIWHLLCMILCFGYDRDTLAMILMLSHLFSLIFFIFIHLLDFHVSPVSLILVEIYFLSSDK